MKIVIVGRAKSGTTALFYSIRSAMPANTYCLFEPVGYEQDENSFVLAKVLINVRKPPRFRDFDGFDRKILIVRDPRDIAVSQLLYSFYSVDPPWTDEQAAPFFALLRSKEEDPRSVSVVELWNFSNRSRSKPDTWIARFDRTFEHLMAFHRAHPEYHLVRYEDFIAGRIQALESYLGLKLPQTISVPETTRRVERAKSSGDWRHWFTPDDVACFKPTCEQAIRYFGYDGDWSLAEHPVIRPEHASGYVRRLIEERRGMQSR